MMDLWDEWIKPGLIIVIILALLTGICFLSFAPLLKITCDAETKDIGSPHRWLFWGGCQVQENGNWIPLENWRYFENK